MKHRSLLVGAVLALWAGIAAPAPAGDGYSPAQVALFNTPHLENISTPVTLNYEFRQSGSKDQQFTDTVAVQITEVLPDGRKNVSFEYLTGKHREDFAPVKQFRGNPVIMAFLQHDTIRMSEITGGGKDFFRNRIRDAFLDHATAEPASFDFAGRKVAGTLVTLHPYQADISRQLMPDFAEMQYEFRLSPEIPGGIYQMRAFLPGGDNGTPVYEEVLTFTGTSN